MEEEHVVPKIRGIKPETWSDSKFATLSPLARLLYIGMWNYACDNGHLSDDPDELRMRVLPADLCDVDKLLEEIRAKGRITRENGVITIPKLPLHQKIDKRWFTTCDHCSEGTKEAASHARPEGRTSGAQRASNGHTAGTRHEVNRGDVNRGDVDGDTTPTRKRAAQLPSDWQPNDTHRIFAANNSLNLEAEVEQFTDHHRAKGSTMKDWDAAFRTWLRNAVKWRKDAPAQPARYLPHASEITRPPDGLSPAEYAAWERQQRERRHA